MDILSRLLMPRRAALTAAATVLTGPNAPTDAIGRAVRVNEQEWQDEAWGFYDSLGMFGNAVTWKADMLSRVRLRAAQLVPGQDEPVIEDTGIAAEFVNELGPFQSQLMSTFAVHLSVPGEGYLVGETQTDTEGNERNVWRARSINEVRYQPAGQSRNGNASAWQVIDEIASMNGALEWRRLDKNAMVSRVWRPHKRFYHMADSAARRARNTMRELELANRGITAKYMSRIASCGMVIFPSEVDFPVRPEFAGKPNSFALEFVEIAAEAIATPGSAAATVPMPIRLPAEYADKVHYIDFTTKEDRYEIEKRDSAVKQLAVDLDVPPEALLGLADANHWTGWLIEESGFKIYLAPDCELICGGLTTGYLTPRLLAAGEDPAPWVVWYDASEITQRPDKSQNAKDDYDRGAISGETLRRETGFDEDDAPNDDELAEIILYKLAQVPATAASALKTLTGVDLVSTPTLPDDTTQPAQPDEAEPQNGPPEQGDVPDAAPPDSAPARAAAAARRAARDRQVLSQAALGHALRVDIRGVTLLHPAQCREHLMSCPVTFATWGPALKMRPGRAGVYACWLNPDTGQAMIGKRLMDADVDAMLPTLDVHP